MAASFLSCLRSLVHITYPSFTISRFTFVVITPSVRDFLSSHSDECEVQPVYGLSKVDSREF
jgi:hypothetical protein